MLRYSATAMVTRPEMSPSDFPSSIPGPSSEVNPCPLSEVRKMLESNHDFVMSDPQSALDYVFHHMGISITSYLLDHPRILESLTKKQTAMSSRSGS